MLVGNTCQQRTPVHWLSVVTISLRRGLASGATIKGMCYLQCSINNLCLDIPYLHCALPRSQFADYHKPLQAIFIKYSCVIFLKKKDHLQPLF